MHVKMNLWFKTPKHFLDAERKFRATETWEWKKEEHSEKTHTWRGHKKVGSTRQGRKGIRRRVGIGRQSKGAISR